MAVDDDDDDDDVDETIEIGTKQIAFSKRSNHHHFKYESVGLFFLFAIRCLVYAKWMKQQLGCLDSWNYYKIYCVSKSYDGWLNQQFISIFKSNKRENLFSF